MPSTRSRLMKQHNAVQTLPLSCKGTKSPANSTWRYHINPRVTSCYKGVKKATRCEGVTANKAVGNTRLISYEEVIQKLGFRSMSYILQHFCTNFFFLVHIYKQKILIRRKDTYSIWCIPCNFFNFFSNAGRTSHRNTISAQQISVYGSKLFFTSNTRI